MKNFMCDLQEKNDFKTCPPNRVPVVNKKLPKFVKNWGGKHFLALLDCQQSSWYGASTCRPSVRRLHSQLVAQLSQNLLNAFLSNFSSRLPWG